MTQAKRDSSADDFRAREFGPYRIVRRLGLGGMAETFEAIRLGPSGFTQRVCLKLVLPFFRDDQDFVRLFEREAKLAAKLRHRNIVGVIDFGSIDGSYFMALELVDGIDLQGLVDALPGKRLEPKFVALIGHELGLALEHAHNPPRWSDPEEAGMGSIVHRDISPSNVLISRQGEVFLADFGVAKAITGASQKQSAVKGKIPYMSPEQLGAQHCDGRADLFSLGVVLFQVLSGVRPFDGGNDPATIIKILNGDHPSLTGLAPSAPTELCALIEQLIEPNLDERPQSALEFLERLEEFVPPPRTQRELGKHVNKVRPKVPYDEGFGDATTAPSTGPRDEREKRTSGIVGSGEGPREEDETQQPPIKKKALSGTTSGASPPKRGERRSRAVLWIGVLLAAGGMLAGATALWFRGTDLTTAPAEMENQSAGSNEPDDSMEVEATAPAEAPEADAKPSPPLRKHEAARPARVTITVFPWGYVWINGKQRGRAPIKDLTLKPGRYKVSAGKKTPTVTRTIRVRSGQREHVKFNLAE